jgi:hypothetical protein
MMRHLATSFFVVLLVATSCLAGPVFTAPFTGSTTVDFQSFTNGTLISNQLLGSHGISFSSSLGGIYANNYYADGMGSSMSATSFGSQQCPCVPVTFTWTNPITRIGFRMGANSGTTEFNLSSGSLNFATPQYPSISDIYILDSAGFTSLTIFAPSNNAFVIDDITYDATTTVPEPASLLLLGLGVGIAGLASRRLRA